MKQDCCVLTAILLLLSTSVNAFDLKADEAQFDTKRKVHYLIGNVIANLNGKTFMADMIVIHMKENGAEAKKVIATGNVSYSDGKILVTAKKCESDMLSVTFQKDVVIKGNDYGTLKADRVVYQIKTGIVNITSKNRVKFVLDGNVEKKLTKKK